MSLVPSSPRSCIEVCLISYSEAVAQMWSVKRCFCEISKNPLFYKTPLVAASGYVKKNVKNFEKLKYYKYLIKY